MSSFDPKDKCVSTIFLLAAAHHNRKSILNSVLYNRPPPPFMGDWQQQTSIASPAHLNRKMKSILNTNLMSNVALSCDTTVSHLLRARIPPETIMTHLRYFFVCALIYMVTNHTLVTHRGHALPRRTVTLGNQSRVDNLTFAR